VARQARRGLAIYFTVLVAGSATVEYLILRAGDSIGHHPGLIFLLMWVPAIAAFVARLVLREGVRDISFRPGGPRGARALLIAWLFPVAVGAIAYGVAWTTGLAGAGGLAGAAPKLVTTLAPSAGAFVRFVIYLGLALTAGTVVGALSAGGEELGWRGYMLTRLVDAGVPQPLLVSGLIWGAWHLPLILSGQYAAGPYPLLSAALFMVDVVGIAIVIGCLRLNSGSIWPAIVLHASWNAVIQGPFDMSSTGSAAALWVGESGVLVAIVSVAGAVIMLRRGWVVRRFPSDGDASPVP
jgi:membrane protease YdiL (CAAX protease family)